MNRAVKINIFTEGSIELINKLKLQSCRTQVEQPVL